MLREGLKNGRRAGIEGPIMVIHHDVHVINTAPENCDQSVSRSDVHLQGNRRRCSEGQCGVFGCTYGKGEETYYKEEICDSHDIESVVQH